MPKTRKLAGQTNGKQGDSSLLGNALAGARLKTKQKRKANLDSTVDGRNIQTLEYESIPPPPNLNVGMFCGDKGPLDKTNQTPLT